MPSTADSLTDFEPLVGSEFRIVDVESGPVELELIEAKSLKLNDANRNPNIRSEAFRLIFRGPEKERYFEQRIFTLSHADRGEMVIFLVPIGPDDTGMRYEAIFN